MNTGLLRHAVATVLTVYGIETTRITRSTLLLAKLQQCLPFTVLKQIMSTFNEAVYIVATVLTVYGIETSPLGAVISHQTQASCNSAYRLRY